jgi:GT2 family glycosyltransferase
LVPITTLKDRALPTCSICIANFNGEQMLDDCLASVFSQKGNVSIEVIVHDDASTDESLAILDKYPQVVRIVSAENVGFCVANNRMAHRARGEFILLLNNDAALYADALETLLAIARANPKASILTLPQYEWNTRSLVDRGCMLDPFYNPVPNLDESRADVAYVIGACLWIPRTLWQSLGGFPPWLESIGEDMYLCCRARLMGFQVQTATKSGFIHRQGASFGGNRLDSGKLMTTYRRRYLSERNKIAVMAICTPAWLVCLVLSTHFVALAVEGAIVAALRRDTRIWREIYGPAISDSLKNRRELKVRRQEIQSQRRVPWREFFRAFVWMPYKVTLMRRYGLPTIK